MRAIWFVLSDWGFVSQERIIEAVAPISFTIAGGADGLVTVASTSGFKVKLGVVISATSLPNLTLEVKKVLSSTTLLVGGVGNINLRSDLSAYTTFLGSTIAQPEQSRPNVPFDDQNRYTFEAEPTLARRVIMVDEFGSKYSRNNPFPTESTEIDIQQIITNNLLAFQVTNQNPLLYLVNNDGFFIFDNDGNFIKV